MPTKGRLHANERKRWGYHLQTIMCPFAGTLCLNSRKLRIFNISITLADGRSAILPSRPRTERIHHPERIRFASPDEVPRLG